MNEIPESPSLQSSCDATLSCPPEVSLNVVECMYVHSLCVTCNFCYPSEYLDIKVFLSLENNLII